MNAYTIECLNQFKNQLRSIGFEESANCLNIEFKNSNMTINIKNNVVATSKNVNIKLLEYSSHIDIQSEKKETFEKGYDEQSMFEICEQIANILLEWVLK